MLRGRLDGADRLITAILPDADPITSQVREIFIRQAQDAIAKDWLRFQRDLGLFLDVGDADAALAE